MIAHNKADALNAAMTSLFQARLCSRGVSDLRRWPIHAP